MDAWVAEGGVPAFAIAGIKYFHPKYSKQAGDYLVLTWPEWVTVRVGGKSVPAGDLWQELQGLSMGWLQHGEPQNTVLISRGMPDERTRLTIAHEAAHASRFGPPHRFYRARFGSDDHSPEKGLMDEKGSAAEFSDTERQVLRGIVP
jgi:hypothetical protein